MRPALAILLALFGHCPAGDAGHLPSRRVGPEAVDSTLEARLAATLEAGGEAEYRRLLALVAGDSAGVPADRLYLAALLRYRLSRAYDAFCTVSPRSPGLELRERQRVGDIYDQVPEDFRAAVVYRRSLEDAYRTTPDTASGAEAEAASAAWTYPDLHRHIATYLRTGAREHLDSIADYRWSEGCGYGSEDLYLLQQNSLLILDLMERDFPAVLRKTRDPARFRQVLQCRGLDWEAYSLGGAVDPRTDIQFQSMAVLTRFGSISALRRLAALDRPDAARAYAGWVQAMGTLLLEPGVRLYPEEDVPVGYKDFVRDTRAPKVPPDLRAEILRRLQAKVARGPYRLDAALYARILSRVWTPIPP